MACRPNTHRPSFHVNVVGLEKTTQRSNSCGDPLDLDAEMTDEEEEFELWLQQALASGLFCGTSKRRRSWSPFKLHRKKGKKQWQRSSQWVQQGRFYGRGLISFPRFFLKKLSRNHFEVAIWCLVRSFFMPVIVNGSRIYFVVAYLLLHCRRIMWMSTP